MKLNKFAALFATTILLVATAACSDDEAKTPLQTATGTLDNSSYNMLSFEWDKVVGALQYSYELTDEAGHVVIADVTNITSVTFTDLQPSTDYTLTVLAYAAIGSNQTTSEPMILHGRTGDVIQLETPAPTYVQENNKIIVSWNHIQDAESYTYSLKLGDTEVASATTKDVSVSFPSLETGSYNFSVVANIDVPGYVSSHAGGFAFDFVRVHNEIWRVTGTYNSTVLNKSWDATLVAYDDNTYSLLAWYGAEGYDLNFSVNSDETLEMSADEYAYDKSSDSYKVNTGIADPTYIYVGPAYSWFEGNAASGELGIDLWNTKVSNYTDDTFIWNSTFDLAGTWTMTVSGKTRITTGYVEESYDFSGEYQITKISDDTYEFPALFFDDETMTVKVDWENLTLTVQPSSGRWDYYTLAGTANASSPVTGTIDNNGKMTFTNWKGYYVATKENEYVYDSVAVFTR